MRNPFYVFLMLAIAFIAIGARRQHAFIYIGIAFLVIAFASLRHRRN